ncbi:zinc finger MYND domain-containing protein 12 isoform X1 [Thamnophis elegans]|uniref:zinc finger MYND domain-containing protein 12 isoform X1 n=1 Tax=Thamnophis elegans TaxID=35005 RepID=UPI00137808DE|nr:zinc finger MYND domain-containing protein 12 isoform X1 [Thamnophis elegans]
MAMQTEWLVPLAQPRQKKRRCELCLGPANVRCAACLVTYYCDVDHQNADWVSVHAKICQLLIPLRAAPPFYTSEKERKLGEEQRRNREIFLADVTYETAQTFLIDGQYEDAIPAALHSLKFSISIYGSSAVELVPPYLILAETSLGLAHLSQAEEYLAQAQWIVLKNTHCSYHVQSKLYRNLGLLHATKGNLEEALYHLANDIYFACCAFGTTRHVSVSGGFFHMANIFSHKNKMDIVDSLYCEVVDLWYDHFSHFVEIQYQKLITPAEVDLLSVEDGAEEDVLDEKQRAEAMQMLKSILAFREASLRQQPEKEAKLLHTLAMFHFLVHDLKKAEGFVMRCLQTAQSLPERQPDESLYHLVKLLQSKEEQAPSRSAD